MNCCFAPGTDIYCLTRCQECRRTDLRGYIFREILVDLSEATNRELDPSRKEGSYHFNCIHFEWNFDRFVKVEGKEISLEGLGPLKPEDCEHYGERCSLFNCSTEKKMSFKGGRLYPNGRTPICELCQADPFLKKKISRLMNGS